MITYDVVQEQHGWAIRIGGHMTSPFRLREHAVHKANQLARALRGHGQAVTVVVEGAL